MTKIYKKWYCKCKIFINEEIDQFFKLQSDEGKDIKDENKISTYVYNEDKESKTNTTGVL